MLIFVFFKSIQFYQWVHSEAEHDYFVYFLSAIGIALF